MKARIKATGEIIEVKDWSGRCELYSDPDMNRFYQAEDLDILPEKETAVLDGWIARDGDDGTLWMYPKKPLRDSDATWYGKEQMQLPTDFFPSVTWESGPKRVKVKIELEE